MTVLYPLCLASHLGKRIQTDLVEDSINMNIYMLYGIFT